MGTIQIDLFSEMSRIMRRELEDVGYKVNIPDDRELMMYYFTMCMRIVKSTPRTVHEAAGFSVPEARREGYEALKKRFERGESVIAHMSKQIKGLKFQDKMLFDWGIHHFHLGTTLEEDGFFKQYDEIVYAIVDEHDVYMIAILGHEHWSDKKLLEIILANWPHLLDPYRVDGKPVVNFSSNEVQELRDANVNVMLTLSDDHGYMGRGIGMTSAGTSSNAMLDTIRIQKELRKIEEDIREKFIPKDGEHLLFSLSRTADGIFLEEPHIGFCQKMFEFCTLKKKIS